MTRAARAAVAVAALLTLPWLHRGLPLGWDELEFFRATKWVSEGRVPFRDFWEHHTPLQWLLFAPVAWFVDSPGADAVVAMRWAQLALWVAILILVMRFAREQARWWALLLLLATPLFVRPAIEYRVDVLGHLGFLAALTVALRGRWVACGFLMSAAVLANMRLAPLVVITSAMLMFWRDERWRFNPRSPRMLIGLAAAALPFLLWLWATGAWDAFFRGVVRYNVASSDLLEVDTLREQLLLPLLQRDPAAIALWCAAIAGCVLALREIRAPRVPQIVALVFIASVVTVAMLEVQYEYHWALSYLLMVPLAGVALERVSRWSWLAIAVAAAGVALSWPMPTEPMRYQDYVMREADRRTAPDGKVFDGSAYAIRREPAYAYWFLPTGIRLLAASGNARGYDIAAQPPAAIIHNLRMQRWFEIFPRTAAFAVRNYVPLTRDLWVPGLSVRLEPGQAVTWTVHRAGDYALWASEPLVRHPWLSQPLRYAAIQGPLATRYAIPLPQLPRARVRWSVDGVPVNTVTVRVKKGSRVSIVSDERRPIGVLLVPSDVRVLCTAPAEEFQF
jgi:hypothetical protein